jgi:hypothetical protein
MSSRGEPLVTRCGLKLTLFGAPVIGAGAVALGLGMSPSGSYGTLRWPRSGFEVEMGGITF